MSHPYVVGDSSPFLKSVLIPFWVVRIAIMAIQVVLYVLLVVALVVYKDTLEAKYNLGFGAVLAITCVAMAIILLCMILDIVCIIKRARRTLSPPFFLAANIVQSIFYVTDFALTMANPHKSVTVIYISVFILVSFLGLLVYAAIVYHQYRTGSLAGSYMPTVNPEMDSLVVSSKTSYSGAADYPAPLQLSHAPHKPPRATASHYDPESVGQVRQVRAPGDAAANSAFEPFRSVDLKTEEPEQPLDNGVDRR
ncbi:hypothetical protein VTH06DRAFT_5347 [Thermothelomyces fergusii]